MTPPKPASPCEHDYNGVIWKEQIHGGRTARKDEYPICPFCKPALEKPVSSCPHDRGLTWRRDEYYSVAKSEGFTNCPFCVREKPAEGCEPRVNYLNIVPDSYHCGTCGKNNLPVPPLKHDCKKVETQDAGEIARNLVRDWLFKVYPNVQDYASPPYLIEMTTEAIKAERAKSESYRLALEKANELINRRSKERAALEQKLAQAEKNTIEVISETRNNYCPCCHARLDEIAGPCKWCKDKHFDTEREMHKAWRKRAEQAEKESSELKTKFVAKQEALEKYESKYGAL